MLTKQETYRYARHLSLDEIGEKGQLKLKKARVLIVGAGGLGCPILQYLVAAGIGNIGVIDDDVVDVSNLQRQILFNAEDVGEPKVTVAEKKLKSQNEFVEIVPIQERLSSSNALDIISKYEIVIDGSDNFSTKYLINDACVILDKPLVFGSILKFEGQVSVFNYNKGPSYRCLYPSQPQDEGNANCSETGVLGILPGTIGMIMATECLKIILNIGEILSGKLLIVDTLGVNYTTLQFAKNDKNFLIHSLPDTEVSKKHKGEREIFAHELQELLESDNDISLIDVRTEAERSEGHIEGSLSIPLSRIEEEQTQLPGGKMIFYCKSGMRSQRALIFLLERGFDDIFSLKGGYEEWKNHSSLI